MAQVNSAGKQAQDYSSYYETCRAKLKDEVRAKKFLAQFGLSLNTARELDLGIDYNSNPKCLPWKKFNKGGRPRLIVPITSSYYIGIAPETVMERNKEGEMKDETILNSNGSTVTPFYPPIAGEDIFFNFLDHYIFVVNDIRDMLALTELGFLAVSINGNGGARKFKEDVENGIWDNQLIFCAKFDYSGKHNQAWEKMKNLKEEATGFDDWRSITELRDFSGRYDSIHERFKADRVGLEEDLATYRTGAQAEQCEVASDTAEENISVEVAGTFIDYKDSEHKEMAKLIDFVDQNVPESRLFIRIPNELAKDHQEGWRFKQEGLRAGVPDYFFAFPSGPYSGLWIEMKRKDGGILSPEQERYINILTSKNFKVAVCHGADEAIAAIVNYLTT